MYTMFGAAALSIDPELVRPLKRSEYDRLIELGLFGDERIELIRGVLVKKAPRRAPHASTVQKLTEILIKKPKDWFVVRVQLPLVLSEDTEPEPDVAVVARGDYDAEHPSTALLIIEVSDATLKTDRAKAAVYASAGIAEYWIINLVARTVEVYTAPDGERYAEVRTLRAGDTLRSAGLPDLAVAVSEILPRA
jgi:Uma2 family endonuclease